MAQADGGDEMPDGVEIDAGRLDQLLASLVEGAAEARAYWSDAWDRHKATERFVGQPFAVEPMDELAGLLNCPGFDGDSIAWKGWRDHVSNREEQ
jgi:hypothetical protein